MVEGHYCRRDVLDEKRPNFDFEGRFIAELNGKPVGIVHAHVDKLRKEKKGFIYTLGVIPEFRGRGVEENLVELALNELRKRGMDLVQAWADHKRSDRILLLEKLDFRPVCRESDMEMDLTNVPSDIGENMQITTTLLQKNVEEDIKTLTWLSNESFKEHFNFRPSTFEEIRHSLYDHSKFAEQEFFFAMLNEKNAGFIGIGIDEKYNIEKNVRCGFILTIGVLKLYRRRGIGTRLMLHGLKSLKAKGMTKAMLDVDDLNPTKAITLYEKIGFTVAKKYLIYERRL